MQMSCECLKDINYKGDVAEVGIVEYKENKMSNTAVLRLKCMDAKANI